MKNLFKEDLANYNQILTDYESLVSEDGQTAYTLAIKSLLNADRWNEIMLNSSKLAKEHEVSKTALYSYCYHKYRVMMVVHEFCRVVFRNCNEESRNRMNENPR